MKKNGCKLFMAVCLMLSMMCLPSMTFAETANMGNGSSRVVKVYKMEGIVTVTRTDGSHPSVFTETELESGDKVEVGKGSQVYLKIDNDKYVMADGETTFVIDISGTAKDSRTKINLISGSIINRVDEKLSQKSSYEIITPNSTTVIRGTLVRTKTMANPDQTQSTTTEVFEGLVGLNTDNQKQQIAESQSSVITTNADGQVKTVTGEIDYRNLSPEQLQFLIDSTETGRTLTITTEELEEIKEEAVEKREKNKALQMMYTYHGSTNTTARDLPADIPGDTDKEKSSSEIDVPFDEVVPQTQ